jgi:aminomethyltransferase
MLKRTPLYEVYKDYSGVKLIDFGGWELPVNFEPGILAEHMAVRENAGLFDVSHMGEVIVEGPESEDFLDWLVTNDVASMEDGQCLYSPMCYPDGGTVDDLMVYRFNAKRYLVVVNAANTDKDFRWMSEENDWARGSKKMPSVSNVSAEWSQIAFQGPKANDYLKEIVGNIADEIGFFRFKDGIKIAGASCLISRTGYTGEDGFEIYCAHSKAADVWKEILGHTKDRGVLPCGLGARDTLRFEAKLPLYGHELTENITPLEANLKVFVNLDGGDFCGKKALVEQKEQGIPRSLRGCKMIDRGVPRNGYPVYQAGGEKIGFVTSGSKSPMLDGFYGLVLIERGIGLKFGDEIEIEINGKRKRAELVRTPFYKRT